MTTATQTTGTTVAGEYDEGTGTILTETYLVDGVPHREDGPASITYDAASNRRVLVWMLAGVITRPGRKPAYVFMRENGTTIRACWYVGGVLHRKGAAAIIDYDSAGRAIATRSQWYSKGRRYCPLCRQTLEVWASGDECQPTEEASA
jgi:hypothetical protein